MDKNLFPVLQGGALSGAKDPVCGMTVSPEKAAAQVEHGGKNYYFCCQECATKFQGDPERYLQPGHVSSMSQLSGSGLISLGEEKPGAGTIVTVRDPVCGMTVDPVKAAGKYEYQGQSYYFCNPKCKERFQTDPEKYLHPAAQPAMSPKGSSYICPMDPEVNQDHPGACPKCGMALEPETPVLPTKVEWTCPMDPAAVRSAEWPWSRALSPSRSTIPNCAT
jgi:P-type Cu+ transporter